MSTPTFLPLATAIFASLVFAPLLSAADPEPAKVVSVKAGRSDDDIVGRITLVDEQASQVVALLEKITGRIALRAANIPATKINFASPRDLTRREAETALESLLALNGVIVVPEGAQFLKVAPAVGGGAQPWGEAPPLYLDSVAGLPPSSRFVARLFTLKNIPYQMIDPAIQAIVNRSRGGSAVPMLFANAVLVTDSLNNIRRIEQIVENVDRQSELLFFPLKNTQAADVVKQLKALLSGGMSAAFAGTTTFEVSPTNNTVVVFTNPSNGERVKKLIEGFDAENAAGATTVAIPLAHAEASAVVALIQNIASGTSGVIGEKTQTSFTAPGAEGANSRSGSSSSSSNSQARPLGGQNRPGQPGGSSSRSTGPENSTFSNYFTVVADQRSNAIVVYGTQRDIRETRELIQKIDVVLKQVRIEAIIVEVTLGTGRASGLDTLGLGVFSGTQGIQGGRHNGDYNFNAAQPLLPGAGAPPFTIAASLKDFSFQTVLNKARTDQNVKLLSSPTLVTSHNAKATVVVSTQQPVINGSTTSNNGGGAVTSASVTYQDIGLELDIVPRIGDNGTVEMDVLQSLKSIIGNVAIDGNQQPIISNRAANSYLTAKDGETIVLAGLQSFSETKTKGKMFILGYIPLIGDWLFSPETTEVTKTELIVFLKPHIITPADKVPSGDTPGLRDGSATKDSALNRISDGVFREMKEPRTYFEEEEAEKKQEEREEAEERAAEANKAK